MTTPTAPVRGFAFPSTGDLGLVATIAGSAEEFGYRTVWTNDAPPGDGLACATAMLEAAQHIRVGVGAVAVDRRPPTVIAQALDGAARGAAGERLVVVLGAGMKATVNQVRAAVGELRDLAPDLTVGVAAMGPKMCRMGGEVADLVLLNWMNPERIAWARERIREGAANRLAGLRAPEPEVASYVRVALGQGAGMRVAAEASRYNQMPQYAQNFAAMGVASAGIGAPDPEKAIAMAEPYEAVLDETVLRCIVNMPAGENPELDEVFEALGVLMETASRFAPAPPADPDQIAAEEG
ncbi:MAG TPA: LLM class flavin-dependent oxidoreductase [Actinomycetota bacterium]|nr:LLM class flavin-dependent oxidoreductase [Actinomycetota bacterium]